MLVTLNSDGVPNQLQQHVYRLGGVGGGQAAGETLMDCALREGREELESEVFLQSAPVTYFHDIDTGELVVIEVQDEIKPLLLERMTNPTPDRPYKHGLPTGAYLYFGLFLAEVEETESVLPGDDVQGLLWLPFTAWSNAEAGETIESLIDNGAQLIAREEFDVKRRVYVPQDESFSTIISLFNQHPEWIG